MAHVDQLWAGWRADYVMHAAEESRTRRSGEDVPACLMCELKDKGKDYYVIARNDLCFVVMNLYPYSNGHVMVVPVDHHQHLDDFSDDVRKAAMELTTTATRLLREIYNPDGINVGINMGEAAGAGVPGHLHIHILPRWSADAGFITTVANTRTLPETLESSYTKLHDAWPEGERI